MATESSNVWVRHSLLVSALKSSSSSGGGGGGSVGSVGKPLISGYQSATSTTKACSSSSSSSSSSALNSTKEQDDQTSQLTAVTLTTSSSMASTSSAGYGSNVSSSGSGSGNGSGNGTAAAMTASESWGWVKARLDSSSGGNKSEQSGEQTELNLCVTITDAESDYDGRAISIPMSLVRPNNNGRGKRAGSSSNNSSSGTRGGQGSHVLGEGIVMANSWAHFASSHPTQQHSATTTIKNNNGRFAPRPSNTIGTLTSSNSPLDLPPADLIHLTHLHEPAVVYCLRYRYALNEIYTATGPILLALNPFKDCRKSLYSGEMMRGYWERGEGLMTGGGNNNSRMVGGKKGMKGGKGRGNTSAEEDDTNKLPPHVYAVADNAYRAMMRSLDDQREALNTSHASHNHASDNASNNASTGANPKSSPIGSANQSILVSGESGAGKTVTAKFLMQYLAALSQRSAAQLAQVEVVNRPILASAESVEENVGSYGNGSAMNGSSGSASNGFGTGRSSAKKKPPPRLSHFGTAVDSVTASKYVAAHPSLSPSSKHRHHHLDHHLPAHQYPTTTTYPTTSSSYHHQQPPMTPRTPRMHNIEQQVLESNPILESFGNARTIRNDNSSRFGKFIEINFCEEGMLIGATIETYLLEKVRLISHADGERNYHIFYELLAGASGSDQKKLMIDYASPEHFVMTRSASGTYHRRDGVHDESTYRDLRQAMTTMGFDVEEQLDIFEIVAALLHLSNLTFVEQGHDECLLREDNFSLEAALELCGVTLDHLEAALCSVVIEAGGERLVKTLGMAQCTKALEALIKATYGALFEYLVRRVNGCIASGVEAQDAANDTAAFIGVLDIFGFESFQKNSFEQLCINYCNESLQQQFNKFVFKLEQAEYEREGISWKFIDFPDNQDILDLIDKRHTGVLSLLDEQCMQAFNTDQSLASSLYGKHCTSNSGPSASFAANNGQKARGMFNIHHYAGPVEYNTAGFLEKNKDETPKEINELLASSDNHFLQHLGEIILSRPMASNSRTPSKFGAAHHHKQSSLIRVSVGKQFSTQLKQLRTRIDATSPHYIRCLKPNNDLRPDHFDSAIIADQLRYAGILEAIRVSRVGYPQRYVHERFVNRYRILAIKELQSKRSGRNPAEDCKALIHAIAKKVWARQHNVSLGKEDNPFSLPHTRGKKRTARASSAIVARSPRSMVPRTPGAITPFRPRGRTPPPSARSKTHEQYKANATPPPWANHKLRATPRGSTSTPSESFSTPNESQAVVKIPSAVPTPKPPISTNKKPKKIPTPAKIPAQQQITIPDRIDLMDIGVQLGKTKVFLRQHAFDAMESMRNRLKTIAATMINSAARMYLCRIAYLPVRDAYREAQDDDESFWISTEHEEDEYYSTRSQCSTPMALVEHFEKNVRIQPKKKKKKIRAFKWLLVDGYWRRNVNYEEHLVAAQQQDAMSP